MGHNSASTLGTNAFARAYAARGSCMTLRPATIASTGMRTPRSCSSVKRDGSGVPRRKVRIPLMITSATGSLSGIAAPPETQLRNARQPRSSATATLNTNRAEKRANVLTASTRTTEASREGARTAWLHASQPPKDTPTRCTSRRSNDSSTADSHSAWSAALVIGAVCVLIPGSPSGSTA
ncbi:hypothetical protein GCM10022247_67140 [Allokutzneria multivorans]|uniref:Uncharacterized protein n=1 Tax=Allokutzneria multivorans TaxID=1142134 RepID=A0ABP7TXC3_9PSEU